MDEEIEALEDELFGRPDKLRSKSFYLKRATVNCAAFSMREVLTNWA
jgi:hypothetical protein